MTIRGWSGRIFSVVGHPGLRGVVAALVVANAFTLQAAGASAAAAGKEAGAATAPVHVATTHPMRYQISLPKDWSPARTWPVLVAPNAHYSEQGKSLALFAAERDARGAPFLIVVPFVINADRVEIMTIYRGAVADAIRAADAATDDGFRDEDARARFDEEGIRAVLKDVREHYRGEDRVYVTGFSSSTHVAYLLLFNHPELLKGVMINSGVYLARGVDEDRIPLLNSPERAGVAVKFIIGEKDPGYMNCWQNWEETRAELIRCGHPAGRIQAEVIKVGNPEHLSAGHNWYPTRILDFCMGVERGAGQQTAR